MNVSVLIMTLNEEVNLPACLASLDWCDDIVVLDSFSSDRTVEIARAAGARVFQRAYDTEDRQRMYGLTEIKFKHDWVYTPDADEITPPDLRDEMLAIAADPDRPEVFFKARYKNMFMGRWIRHASLYPTWITRLVRPDRVRFERSVHSRASGGPEGALQAHFIHYSFNKGLEAWYDKHNRYSSAEADLSASRQLERKIDWGGMLSAVPERRRRALKSLSYHMPFRPGLRFLYMYLLRGGFLDGKPGYLYCRLLSAYEFMIVVKMEEQRQRRLATLAETTPARQPLETEAPERRMV
ncbi:glycosyltransferase involved in cell wall biosynthesis [Ochrobactrum sp. RH1CCR137]|uniref:glycosyltransferase family 2 protein n=1 Tax=Brucella intermedia TaxID=94625 RepID=UPI000DD85EE7|nr:MULTISPECIES: glycosyltransferase family 2 protein [Brucella/Ochrobactrum group]MBA8844107.1 glycosyltransferase involved in cell wall biosynthesis [Ochrobactrum sp. RH1CCR137]MBA8856014.1 glycosyltransferase involved in cell wall biosynthesis [Ochrobactrum sp. RH1CCR134]